MCSVPGQCEAGDNIDISNIRQIGDSTGYWSPNGLLIKCPKDGGEFRLAFGNDYKTFFDQLLDRFDEALRPSVKLYVELGWAREWFKIRANDLDLPKEKADAHLKAMSEFFDEAELQYVAAGFVPIDFEDGDPHDISVYEAALLERAAVVA